MVSKNMMTKVYHNKVSIKVETMVGMVRYGMGTSSINGVNRRTEIMG